MFKYVHLGNRERKHAKEVRGRKVGVGRKAASLKDQKPAWKQSNEVEGLRLSLESA